MRKSKIVIKKNQLISFVTSLLRSDVTNKMKKKK